MTEELRYKDKLNTQISNLLTKTNLDFSGLEKKLNGKVRDIYIFKNRVLLVTTDRLSAFDRTIAAIPFKGQVLTGVSEWWFKETASIVPNHLISRPDPHALLCRRCTIFPVEIVVRGYITGTTSTSLWTHYKRGEREYCGHKLQEGLREHQRLPNNLVTPTTKAETHDEPISAAEIIERGLMTRDQWNTVEQYALKLFAHGQQVAESRGLILVDTKYEFGIDVETGEILLVDEVHTPDSSRYWMKDSYESRIEQGLAPLTLDKDVVRRWYSAHCDPYKDAELPDAPTDLVLLVAQRYIDLYEHITGQKFPFPSGAQSVEEELQNNLSKVIKE